jgi:hypothetical protein
VPPYLFEDALLALPRQHQGSRGCRGVSTGNTVAQAHRKSNGFEQEVPTAA